MSKTMNIGIDHGYYAIKTRHFSFPAGIAEYEAMKDALAEGEKPLRKRKKRKPQPPAGKEQ